MLNGSKNKNLPFWSPDKRRKTKKETHKEQSNSLTAEVDLMKISKPQVSDKGLPRKLNKEEITDNKTTEEEKEKLRKSLYMSKISPPFDPYLESLLKNCSNYHASIFKRLNFVNFLNQKRYLKYL